MIVSYFRSPDTQRYYHLHREFVRADRDRHYTTTLCNTCHEALVQDKKLPTFSLAAGMDFGNADRIFLPKLTLAEEYVLAFARLFILIIKLAGYQRSERQAGKLGHAIVFSQYGAKLEEEVRRARQQRDTGTYPRIDDLHESLSIVFVGSQVDWAAMVRDTSRNHFKAIKVEAEKIYMWLRALKTFNPRYRDIVIDDSPEMTAALERIPEELIQRKTFVENEKEINIDKLVRQQAETPATTINLAIDEETETESDTYPMSFLTRSAPENVENLSTPAAALRGKLNIFKHITNVLKHLFFCSE
jgi:hypothetical protein